MADASDAHINSVPSVPPAPYDATSDAAAGPWVKISANPAAPGGGWDGDFGDGPGPWRQT